MCNIYIINTNICYINISHIISLQSQFISSLCSGWQSTWYLDRWADRHVKPAVRCSVQVVTLIRERPQKVSITQEIETSLEYPTLTICSPAFFDKSRHSRGQPTSDNFLSSQFRLATLGLDDENDDLANYLILSLQVDQITPRINVNKDSRKCFSEIFLIFRKVTEILRWWRED